jgi:hypothetical protein
MALLQKGYLGATPLWKNVDWFQPAAYNIVDNSAVAGVTVTANSSAHTKGSYAQLIASTAADASFIVVQVYGVGAIGANTATLLDLATGASGSEVNFASNIAIGGLSVASGGLRVGGLIGFPIKIASGTRISARIQSVVTGGKTASLIVFLINAGDYATAPTSVDVIGSDTATSQGTSFSGASGTWVQATASTSQAYRAVTLVGSSHDAAMAAQTGIYEMGVGASGSEVGFGEARYEHSALEFTSLMTPYVYMSGRNIPSGSRLAVKHPITADPSKYGFCLIGIP